MKKTLLIFAATAASMAAAESGRAIYMKHCEPCHGTDGAAGTAMGRSFKIRDLRSAEVRKQTDAELQAIVSKGKNGRMPAFGESLGPDGVKKVVAYLRTMKGSSKK